MKMINRVKPSKTSTKVILIVDVILAFKNRAVDTFLLLDIHILKKKGDNE